MEAAKQIVEDHVELAIIYSCDGGCKQYNICRWSQEKLYTNTG